jgi:hypothetical protein
MFKWIFLLFGLGVGFGSGVYWGVHHPDQAATLSAQEEQQVLEQTQALKNKLDQVINKQKSSSAGPGASFLGGGSNGPGAVDPDLKEADQKAQQQIDMLKAKLHK